MSADSPLLLLVDGHSLAFRSYYAFAKGRDGGLRTRTGIPTSVCFGFLKALLEVMEQQQPQALAIAFDLGGPTFRHAADENYKANRDEAPEDFKTDTDNLVALLQSLNLPILVEPGFEADDLLGTVAQRGAQAGYRVRILSGDRDLFQLVDPDGAIRVLYLGNTFGRSANREAAREIDPAAVIDKLGVPPEQVIDFKALCGDSSDNIPGVKGIGPKTAVELLQAWGDLDRIYDNLEAIKPAVRKKLESDREAAYHSRKLAQIVTDIPLAIDWDHYALTGFDEQAVLPWLEKLELQAFRRQVDRLQQLFGGQTPTVETLSDESLDFWTAEETAAQQPRWPQLQPQIITTAAALADLVTLLEQRTDPEAIAAWDTETTDLDPRKAQLVGIGCAWGEEPDQLAYIPLGHAEGEQLPLEAVLAALRPILESDRYPKAFQNAKFDRLILRHQGIELAGVVFDTMLASYLLNPSLSHSLDALADRWLKVQTRSYSDLVPKGKTIADVAIAAVAQYCGSDVHVVQRLLPLQKAAIAESPALRSLLETVELPLEAVLAAMEDEGIRIDEAYLAELSEHLKGELDRLEEAAYEVAGDRFNLGSPKQLSELLFEKLGLNIKKSRKTKTGYSTDAAVLEKLQGDHPIIDLILEHRTLAKLKSTYVDALPTLVAEDGRIHTDFNQAVTATGRLSSSNPNLQNIPIRTEFSRQIRKAFLPREGWLLAAADYSQIELRILAHLSQEPVLLDAYRQGDDVHRLTASLLFDRAEITPAERRIGKIINFGVIYGMGAQRFARETGTSTKEAQGFIDRFYDRYPRVFAYLQSLERQAIARGYVETVLGRRRYFDFEETGLNKLRGADPDSIDLDKLRPSRFEAQSLRAAANAPIQGSSADIIKVAMVQLQALLQPYQARMLLQVHDELVLELPPEEWDSLAPQIQQTMEQAVQLTVPLAVELHAGQNWMDAK